MDFYVTSNAAIGTSLGYSGADVYYSVISGKDYVGVVDLSAMTAQQFYHEPGSGGATGDPLNQVDEGLYLAVSVNTQNGQYRGNRLN